jgi:hypothetical protein
MRWFLESARLNRLDPADVIGPRSVFVRNQGFVGHLSRREPSKAPGVDLDVTFQTEGLPSESKPEVRTPVSGTVELSGGSWGAVRIRDENGYAHTLLHMDTATNGIEEGTKVERGDTIGILSNTRTTKDHVHYYIQDRSGRLFLNPENVYFDSDGAVRGVFDYDQHRFENWMQDNYQQPKYEYDNVNPPDVSGIS